MTTDTATAQRPPTTRLRIGTALFIGGQLVPLTIPLTSHWQLSSTWKPIVTGMLLFGIPELCTLCAVAILGASGFRYLKQQLFAAIGRLGPPERVSRTRYRIGLSLFGASLLFGWASPYLQIWWPDNESQSIAWVVVGDVMLLVSLFVLGGAFWDKVRALFIYEAAAELPADAAPH